MRLISLTLHNFMPYGGDHELAFPTKGARNVTVVYGDNMRGKTSIMNAIRWCLYGRALGRHLKILDLSQMINSDAAAKGDFRIHVYLRFENDGNEYDLRRTATPRELIGKPRNAGDFRTEISLRKNGTILRGDEIEHELNQIAPEQISRFFLFDGELLQEYETLLTEGSEQGQKIKASIEQVLGVPALLDGRKRLGGLLRQAQSVQAKENSHVSALRGLAEQQLQHQAKLTGFIKDLAALETREHEIESEIETLDESLAATEATERAKSVIDGLDKRRQDLMTLESHLKHEKRTCLKDAWRDLLQPRLRLRIAELETASTKFRDNVERTGALKEQERHLQAILDNTTCPTCGNQLSPNKRYQIGADLGRVQGLMLEVNIDIDKFSVASEELTRLRRLSSTRASERLRHIDTQLDKVAISLTEVESESKRLQEQIRGADTAEIARIRTLRDQQQRNLGKVQHDATLRREEIESLTLKQNELARLMSKNTDARSRRSNREVELYGNLERIFSEATEVLRDRMRNSVAAQASETFMRLTTEKTYRGLQINDNYGLAILDRDGRTVSIRSAGAEQIVALSLINGLNRTARKRGPIIMDTPLGRLDPKHRQAVLREVPKMADQVVLLVHEGEIDRERDLAPIAPSVAAMYDIVRISSSQSRIENSRGNSR